MKDFSMNKLLMFLFIAIITLGSCKKDKENAELTNGADITVNNVKTSFTNVLFVYESEDKSYEVTNYGPEMDVNSIEIYLLNPSMGDVTINSDNYLIIDIGEKCYLSKSGKFTISKISDSEFSGTFSGTFTDEVDVDVQISGNFTSTPFNLDFEP